MDTAPALLDLRSMARRLRVSMRWLRDEARAGRVPHLAAGPRLLFAPGAVERVLAERAEALPVAANRIEGGDDAASVTLNRYTWPAVAPLKRSLRARVSFAEAVGLGFPQPARAFSAGCKMASVLPFAPAPTPQPAQAWRTIAEAHGQVAGADLASRLDQIIARLEQIAAHTSAAPATVPIADDSETLIDWEGLGRILKVSVRTVRRMESGGELPPSIAGGRQRLYLRDEIDRWLRQGRPPREEWEARGRK